MNFDSSAFIAEPELIEALSARAEAVDCDQDRVLRVLANEVRSARLAITRQLQSVNATVQKVLRALVSGSSLRRLSQVLTRLSVPHPYNSSLF